MKRKKIIILIILIVTFSFIVPKNSMAFLWWDDPIYKEPEVDKGQTGSGLDRMIKDAEEFEKEKGEALGQEASTTFELDQENLQTFSSELFTILIVAATAVSVVVGIILGIKYVTGSVEAKAQYKELLIPYIAGCAVVYGALGIWKLCVTILGNV